jgi:hypothetical protein
MFIERISVLFTLFKTVVSAVLHDLASADLLLTEHRLDVFESEVIPDLCQMAEMILNCAKFAILLFSFTILKNQSHIDSDQENKVDEDSIQGLSDRIFLEFCRHHDFLSHPCLTLLPTLIGCPTSGVT